MTHPRLLAAVIVVPALVLAAACGGDDDSDTAATTDTSTTSAESSSTDTSDTADTVAAGDNLADGITCEETQGAVVAYSEPIPDPNFAAIEATIQNVLDTYGASLTAVNANLDPGKQISDVQSLIQQQVDVVLINPVAPEPLFPAFDAIREAGIPLVVQDTARGGPFLTNISADVEAAAAEGAVLLADKVDGGQVAAVNGPDFAEVLVRENEAFKASAEAEGLTVVDSQVNQPITPDAARSIADGWKQRFGADLAGIWTFNDTSAVGVASAVGDDFTPVIVSINGQPEAIPLVESGVIDTTFDLQQDKLGQALAYSALAAICGVDLPTEIVIPNKKIDASNVAEWRPLEERTEDPFEISFEERDGRSFLVTE